MTGNSQAFFVKPGQQKRRASTHLFYWQRVAQGSSKTYRIAVLFYLWYDGRTNETKGLSAILDDDWQSIR